MDATIEGLLEYFEAGDVIIDGGNSNYNDSERRFKQLKEKGIHFVGCGVSGGEEGALKGPSISKASSCIAPGSWLLTDLDSAWRRP